MRTYYLSLLSLLACTLCMSQSQDSIVMSFSEYLGYVKKHHPIVKQAELTIQIGQANLMKARGGFDPKIEVDQARKTFKSVEYFEQLNATFKIPTWYGIELKGNFEQNSGVFLNPQNSVPEDGLYSAGISASLGQGLFINKRMADLKKAQLFREQTKADRAVLVNQILYDASLAYFKWLKAYNETQIYTQFLSNAELRFRAVKRSAETGDKAAIDSVEAKIAAKKQSVEFRASKSKINESLFRTFYIFVVK